MGLIDQARQDLIRFTSDPGGFALPVSFTAPGGAPVTVFARATKHRLSIDRDTGLPTNAKNASVSVAEALLTLADYPTRNGNNEAAMIGHRVAWTDSTGTLCNYVITECWPDEFLGLLVCILADYR